MTMNKPDMRVVATDFTPGPWVPNVRGEDGRTYADTWTEANARLIASAPDLYDALENLLRELADDWATEEDLLRFSSSAIMVKAIIRGRRALAKARGESVSA